MPWLHVIWTDANRAHLAEHGVTAEEVDEVFQEPDDRPLSGSSDRPMAVGYTATGRYLVVVYEHIDAIAVYPSQATRSKPDE